MLGSQVLETAAGLAFVFLLLSVLVSALNEWIAATLSLRARDLETALRNLLGGDMTVAAPTSDAGASLLAGTSPARAFLSHSMIQNLCAPKLWGKGVNGPAYLEAKTFSAVLLDFLMPGNASPSVAQLRLKIDGMQNTDLKRALLPQIDRASGDIDKARKNIEDWYNQAMDRLSGRYKRRAQLFIFGLGLVLAVGLNVDTIRTAERLWNDPAVRNEVIAQAQNYKDVAKVNDDRLNDPCTASTQAGTYSVSEKANCEAAQLGNAYSQSGMPIGWTTDARENWWPKASSTLTFKGNFNKHLGINLISLFGWFLTAVAISLGAPFWFDFLTKTLGFNARLSGVKPQAAGN
jgi:hypothetical protein